MELLQLKYFCHAAETENFSKTAKHFSVPPSDISQSIRRLEKELGKELFLRSSNRISLNNDGKAFWEKVSRAIDLLEEAVEVQKGEASQGEICLCINTIRRIVMNAVERFQKEEPKIHIKTRFFSVASDEHFDLVIDAEDSKLGRYRKTKLLSEPLALAVPSDSPWAQGEIDPSSLKDEGFITTGEQNSLFRLTHSFCLDGGFSPKITIQSDDPYYIRKCVESGFGVALVPTISWRGQFSDRITLKSLPSRERTTYLYDDPKKRKPRYLERFIHILKEECEKEEE